MNLPPEHLLEDPDSPVMALKSIAFHGPLGGVVIEFSARQPSGNNLINEPTILSVVLPFPPQDEPTDLNAIVADAYSALEDRLKLYLEEISSIRMRHNSDTT